MRADVVAATLAEVTEKGYDGLTVEAVATRSGVHKATLYRRWGGVDGLVAEALTASADQAWPLPDTGDLQEDLRSITQEVHAVFTDPDQAPTPIALIAAAQRSDTGAAALRAFFAARHHQAARVAERAVARGELPAGTDGAEVVRAATAPLYYRLFVTGEPLDAHTAERAADAAALAARAGLFTPSPKPEPSPGPGPESGPGPDPGRRTRLDARSPHHPTEIDDPERQLTDHRHRSADGSATAPPSIGRPPRRG